MSLFYKVYQQGRISAAQAKAESAQEKAQRLQSEIAELRRHSDALTLGCQAMWELLCEKTGLTNDAIEKRIREIDVRDGIADGRIGEAQSKQCGACGRVTSAAREICLYCGEPLPMLPRESVFNKR